MNDTQENIIKGCKYILNLASRRWDSDLNKAYIKRMRDRCQQQLDEWESGVPGIATVDTMSDDEIAETFQEE